MILDISGLRRKSGEAINEVIFEIRMKGYINKKKTAPVISSAGFIFIAHRTGYDGIHSYEMMNQAVTSGDFVNSLLFGLLPVLQGVNIYDLKMINTYVKDRISA